MIRTKAVVMAGGTATRLYPVTKAVSKHLLPVGRYPMICYPLGLLQAAGYTDVCLVVSHDHREAYKELLGFGTSAFSISYVSQTWAGGIAQGIVLAEEFLEDEPFTLMLGDNIYFGDALLTSFAEARLTALAKVYSVWHPYPAKYGVLTLHPVSGRPERVVEKPQHPDSNLIATGIYVLPADAPSKVKELVPSIRDEYEISELLTKYAQEDRLHHEEVSYNSWLDVGTWPDYEIAQGRIKHYRNTPIYQIP